MATITTKCSAPPGFYRADRIARYAVTVKQAWKKYDEPLPWWKRLEINTQQNNQAYLNVDRLGNLRGITQIGSGLGATVAPFVQIYLYHRPSGQLIGMARSDATGAFSFSGLDRNSNDYFIVAVDFPYNTQTYDRLYPKL